MAYDHAASRVTVRRRDVCCKAPSPSPPPPPSENTGKQQITAAVVGVLYLGNFVAVMFLGVLSRLGVTLPPVNTLTDIANNAMDAEIAAGTLQPLVATAWATRYWVDLLAQYFAAPNQDSFVATWCSTHAAELCTSVVY
jgi:hypothetical protein